MKVTNKQIAAWLNSGQQDEISGGEIPGFRIRRIKSKAGQAAFRLVYRNQRGKQKALTIGTFPAMTLTEARDIARQKYAEIKSGINIDKPASAESFTVGQYLDDIYSLKLERQKTGRDLVSNIRNHFGHLFKRSFDEIECSDIRRWQRSKEDAGLSHSTLVKVYGTFKGMINYAVTEGHISANPIASCHLLRKRSSDKKATDGMRIYLTPEQAKGFLAGVDGYEEMKRNDKKFRTMNPDVDDRHFVDRVKPSMLLLYYNGIRIGDVITMDWSEFQPQNKALRFTPNKIEHKKSDPQVFPVNDIVHDALMKWWEQSGRPAHGPMFPNPKTGKPYNKKSFRRVWPVVREIGGLPEELHLQALRHNFASQLIMKGQPFITVAKLMATSTDMIENFYGHLRPDLKSSALDIMIGLEDE